MVDATTEGGQTGVTGSNPVLTTNLVGMGNFSTPTT